MGNGPGPGLAVGMGNGVMPGAAISAAAYNMNQALGGVTYPAGGLSNNGAAARNQSVRKRPSQESVNQDSNPPNSREDMSSKSSGF